MSAVSRMNTCAGIGFPIFRLRAKREIPWILKRNAKTLKKLEEERDKNDQDWGTIKKKE